MSKLSIENISKIAYKLSLLIEINQKEKKALVIHAKDVILFTTDISEIDRLQKENFSKVCISQATSLVTLIPQGFYAEEEKENVARMLFPAIGQQQIKSQHIPSLNTVMLFSTPLDYVQYTQAGVWMEYLLYLIRKNQWKNQVFVHLEKDFLHLAYFQEKKLLFFNAFAINSIEDALYFILYTYHQLDISSENIPLRYSGNITQKEELINTLKQYIRTVLPLPAPDFLNIPADISSSVVSSHLPLYSQILCV